MSNEASSQIFRAELVGRDFIELDFSKNKPQVRAQGCPELISTLRKYQVQFGNDPKLWPAPNGTGHAELLLKEVLLKSQQQWKNPYENVEICHCRAVMSDTIDQAIVAGAHSTGVISRRTSASTSCGTCRDEVQKMIDFRLKK